jgi:hypothetical protein
METIATAIASAYGTPIDEVRPALLGFLELLATCLKRRSRSFTEFISILLTAEKEKRESVKRAVVGKPVRYSDCQT